MFKSPVRMLLIEDDEQDIELIEIYLNRAKKLPSRLESATSVEEGLKRLQQGGVDIVLCDLSLPDIQGLDTFRQIYAQFPEVPIIILTGLDDEEVALTALSLGAQDYLIKGDFNVSVLVRSIRYALERHQLSDAYKKSEQRYRAIVEDQTELICRYRPDGTLTFVNEAYCRFFGKNREQLLGQNLLALIPCEELEKITQHIQSLLTLTPDNPTMSSEHKVLIEGEIYWLQWIERAIFNRQGKIIEFQSIGRDVTQRKQAESELTRKNLELETAKRESEAANKAKTQFLANMTHELRTPLNAILGFTQLLSREPNFNSQQQEQLQIINRSGEHLLELINDVLEMSKIEAGVVELHPTCFDLYHLINFVQEMLQHKAQSKDLKLIFELSSDLPQYVQTDESKLRQVLINFLSNAIKFTQEGSVNLRAYPVSFSHSVVSDRPPVSVRGNREGADNGQLTIQFEVEDTGCGIAPEELDKLFNAFTQSEIGRKSPEGTGLGLVISQHFVQLMGGKISIKSEVGRGTIVAFDILVTLPTTANNHQLLLKKRVLGLAPDQPQYRLLVAEDRWESRHLLVKMLSPVGFEVFEATNGQEAVELWDKKEPHLILMDMRMPVMDGYEATKRIRASLKGQATAIIAITASAFDDRKAAIMAAGCNDFIHKPFREEVLLEKIAHHLGVRYIYESSEISSHDSAEASKALTSEDLKIMPSEWHRELNLAAVIGNEEKMLPLIDKIPDQNAAIKLALLDLISNFRFEIIADLTENLMSSQ